MKKFLLICFTAVMAGCSNLPSALTPVGISMVSQEKIAAAVSQSELYAVGAVKIDTAGSFIAEGKARTQARENLKSKISNEVTTIFNRYMENVDSNSKKIYTAALPDLRNYTTETLLLKATEKIALVDDNKSYVAVAVKKEDIAKESKFVFTEYTSSLIKKLESIRAAVSKTDTAFHEIETPELPVLSSENKNISNNDFTTIDEDPLFQ